MTALDRKRTLLFWLSLVMLSAGVLLLGYSMLATLIADGFTGQVLTVGIVFAFGIFTLVRLVGNRHSRRVGSVPALATHDGPLFAFCEPVSATATSKWHIRAVGPEGLKPGGGVPNHALCGRDVRMGWDLAHPVDPEYALRLVTPRPGDGNVVLCHDCHDTWRPQAD